jgi:hypothetical protein
MLPSTVTAFSPAVEAILRRARARYCRLPPHQRPALGQPHNALTLLDPVELAILSAEGVWPLAVEALAWMRQPPRRRRAKRCLPRLPAPARADGEGGPAA